MKALLKSALRNPILFTATTVMLAQMAIDEAAAQSTGGATVGTVADGLVQQLSSVGKVCLGGSFVTGIVMLGGGLMKLKQAADSQGQQTRYAEGLWRLAAGTGLVAIPSLAGVLTSTVGFQGPQISSPTGGANM